MSTTTATPPAAAAATKGARDILLLVLHLRWKSVRRRRTAANFCPAVVPGREARKGERGSRMNDAVRCTGSSREALSIAFGKVVSETASERRRFFSVFLFRPPGWEETIDGTFAWEKYSVRRCSFFN